MPDSNPSNMGLSRSAGPRIMLIRSSEPDLKATLNDPKMAAMVMSNINTVLQLNTDNEPKN